MSYPKTAAAIVRHERKRRERRIDPRLAEAKALYDRWLQTERERTNGGRPTMPKIRLGKAPNQRGGRCLTH